MIAVIPRKITQRLYAGVVARYVRLAGVGPLPAGKRDVRALRMADAARADVAAVANDGPRLLERLDAGQV